MKNRIWTLVVTLPVLFLGLSCNVYSPLNSPSTAAQYEEEALKYLHDGDYAKAIENYGKLPAGQARFEKLCTAYMAESGLGISQLIKIISDRGTGAELMGKLAQAFIPWTAKGQAAAEGARANCKELDTTGSSAKLNTLLRTLGYLADCSMRMARTDQLVTTDDVNCSTAGNGDGVLTPSDISASALGTVSTGNPGMCKDDVLECTSDLNAIAASALTDAGLGDIADNISAIPAGATTTNDEVTGRIGLRSTVPN